MRIRFTARHLTAALAALALLSGCDMPSGQQDPPRAVPRGEPPVADNQPGMSEESRALAERYARIESELVTRGLLRTDGGGPDAPFDADRLATNFMRIALYDEFIPVSGRLVARETMSYLRRWESPVRVGLVHGATATDARKAEDRNTVEDLTRRLRIASDHDIRTTSSEGNLTVFVVDEDERRALEPQLRAAVPGISDSVVRAVTEMPPTTFCLIIAFSADNTPHVYRRAIGIVRAEHPPLLRQSCFHEEITQGLGLANDSPDVRPSIFNDDEEFALLTRQDELMVSILYDPRLQPGMAAEMAAPIVREIANELLPTPEAEPTPVSGAEDEGGPPPPEGET